MLDSERLLLARWVWRVALTEASKPGSVSPLHTAPVELAGWVQDDVARCMNAWSGALAQLFPEDVRTGLEAHLTRLRRSPGSIARLA